MLFRLSDSCTPKNRLETVLYTASDQHDCSAGNGQQRTITPLWKVNKLVLLVDKKQSLYSSAFALE